MPFKLVKSKVPYYPSEAIVYFVDVDNIKDMVVDEEFCRKYKVTITNTSRLNYLKSTLPKIKKWGYVCTKHFSLPTRHLIHVSLPKKSDEIIKSLEFAYIYAFDCAYLQRAHSVSVPMLDKEYGLDLETMANLVSDSAFDYLCFEDAEYYRLDIYAVIPEERMIELNGLVPDDLIDFIERNFGDDCEINLSKRRDNYESRQENNYDLRNILWDYVDGYEEEFDNEEFIRDTNLDAKIVNRVYRNEKYKPSKTTILAICIVGGLSLGETLHYVNGFGYSFCNQSLFDVVLYWCLLNGIHNVYWINQVLFVLGEKQIYKK